MVNKAIKIVASLLIILSVFPKFSQAEETMTIAYPEFFPFFSKTDKGGMTGFFYEIITEAMDNRMGIRTTWSQMPWKRCQEHVKSGKCDAMITVPTKERSLYCDTHSDPFYLKELKLFTYKGHPRLNEINAIKTIEDIKKAGFTIITYSGNGWHENKISTMGIPSYETSLVPNVWKMLAAKRGDLVIEWPIGAFANINKSGVENKIIETGVSLESMPFHLLISKKSKFKNSLFQFNHIIMEMFNDGTMKRIIAKYY